MHEEQRLRAHEQLRARRITHALFASPASVTWLTGFAPPVQLGPNPFAGGPPLVWYAGGEWTVIVLDSYSGAATISGCEVVSYPGYTITEPLNGPEQLVAALGNVIGMGGSEQVGIEERALPLFLRHILTPASGIIPIDGLLTPLRIQKTDEELAKLRAAFALTDIGHAAAGPVVQTGQTEIDVWVAAHAAMQKAAGRRVPLGNDCTVGRRGHSGGWPLDVTIQAGDSFVVDLSTQVDGYWSDSCATYYADAPDRRQLAMHRTVTEALELAISLIKTDAIAGEIDRQVREFIVKAGYPAYPHHTGHGIGVTTHEEPRIVPYNVLRLVPGMVIMLEPGIYFPGETAVRLEDAVLVTDSGVEILTKHSKGIRPRCI